MYAITYIYALLSKMGKSFIAVILLLLMTKKSVRNAKGKIEWKQNYLTKTFVRYKKFIHLAKNHLKVKGFEQSPKHPPPCPSLSYSKIADSLHRQVDFRWHTSAKESS